MSLLALTEAHVAPNRIQTYLGQHFDRTAIMQTVRQLDHRFAVVAFDDDDEPRLVVLFNGIRGCWRYEIDRPKMAMLKALDDE